MRIMIVDDHAPFRGAARALLSAEGCDVVADLATAEAALAGLGDSRPEVVLLDVLLPGMDGLTAAPRILAVAPDAAVVLISTRALEDLGADRIRASGARGFLPKAALSRAAIAEVIADRHATPRNATIAV